MMRWILLAAAIYGLYWLYEHDYQNFSSTAPRAESPPVAPTLEPGGRLGGGLNPFVVDPGHGSGPSRPPMPKIPGAR